MENWKLHLGVYGVYIKDRRLLVVHKTRGPYTGKFDLPGGSFEKNESIEECLKREMLEETGQRIDIINNIYTSDYLVPWKSDDNTHLHHIAVFYLVEVIGDIIKKKLKADDTEGYEMIDIKLLNRENSSPLVSDIIENYLVGLHDTNLTRITIDRK